MADQPNDRQQVQLGPNELMQFDYVSTKWDARIPDGVTPEDLLVPAFWAHQGMKLKPFDEIRVHAEDGTWMANYVVLDCSRNWAKVHLLNLYKLTTADVASTQASEIEVMAFINAHQVTHRGPHKWSVVRKSDKAVLHQGEEQKETAAFWLEALARTTVGAPTPAKAESVTA